MPAYHSRLLVLTNFEPWINDSSKTISIGDIIEGNATFHLKPYTSQAVAIHQAVPENHYCYENEWIDYEKEDPCDIYHAEICQTNNQLAWISPVFVL